jgi:cation transport regulator
MPQNLAGRRRARNVDFPPRSHSWKSSEERTTMPYRTIADLPKAQTDQYNEHQKKAFLEAFNSAYEKYKDDEGHAFAIAHSAAKKAGEKPGPG